MQATEGLRGAWTAKEQKMRGKTQESQTERPSNHDQRALDVARTMVRIISPEDAFLFGSRARGDWNDNSDIDVFTIEEPGVHTRTKYREALQAGRAKAQELYGHPVRIDLVRYSPEDFHHYRQARTHLACSALTEGINMDREPTGYGNEYEELEPNNWPDVEQRFTNYQRQILAAENNLEAGLGYEEVGFHFQRSLENAMKGFLAYMDYDDGLDNVWMRTHNINTLQDAVLKFPEGMGIIGTQDFSFLTAYAIEIPYQGVQDPLPDEASVLESIRETVSAMTRLIEEDSGHALPRYQPPGPRPVN